MTFGSIDPRQLSQGSFTKLRCPTLDRLIKCFHKTRSRSHIIEKHINAHYRQLRSIVGLTTQPLGRMISIGRMQANKSRPSIRTRALQDERSTAYRIIIQEKKIPSRNFQVEEFLRERGGLSVRSPSRHQRQDRMYSSCGIKIKHV